MPRNEKREAGVVVLPSLSVELGDAPFESVAQAVAGACARARGLGRRGPSPARMTASPRSCSRSAACPARSRSHGPPARSRPACPPARPWRWHRRAGRRHRDCACPAHRRSRTPRRCRRRQPCSRTWSADAGCPGGDRGIVRWPARRRSVWASTCSAAPSLRCGWAARTCVLRWITPLGT